MARKILCPDCDKITSGLATKYSELYESIEGVSNGEYICDNCGKVIAVGDRCFAAVLLPNKHHPMYQAQKPEVWCEEYLDR